VEGVVGTGYTGDIAVDDVSFSDGCALVQCMLSNTFYVNNTFLEKHSNV
jgi:hypothetical protein